LRPSAGRRQRAIEEMIDSTVKVTIERDGRRVASASGVVIASRPAGDTMEAVSYVLTAAHTLAGGDGAKVVVGFCGPQAARGKFTATVISPETRHAGSGYSISGIAATRPSSDDDLVRLGQPILVIGFPKESGWGCRVVSSANCHRRVSKRYPRRPAGHRIVIDAAAPRGVSGGGVFERRRLLVGVSRPSDPLDGREDKRNRTLKFPFPAQRSWCP
jgi:S1-C subfamily serine protease